MSSKVITSSDFKLDLEEAIELIDISKNLFQQKLEVIKEKSASTKIPEQIEKYEAEAKILYEDYKRSIDVIDKYIDEVSASSIK